MVVHAPLRSLSPLGASPGRPSPGRLSSLASPLRSPLRSPGRLPQHAWSSPRLLHSPGAAPPSTWSAGCATAHPSHPSTPRDRLAGSRSATTLASPQAAAARRAAELARPSRRSVPGQLSGALGTSVLGRSPRTSTPRPRPARRSTSGTGQERPRHELIRDVFQLCDVDADGVLGEEEIRQFAVHTGFDGDDAEWAEGYIALRSEWLAGADGVAFEVFKKLVEDRTESGWYCSDKRLKSVSAALRGAKAVLKLQISARSQGGFAPHAEPDPEPPTPLTAKDVPRDPEKTTPERLAPAPARRLSKASPSREHLAQLARPRHSITGRTELRRLSSGEDPRCVASYKPPPALLEERVVGPEEAALLSAAAERAAEEATAALEEIECSMRARDVVALRAALVRAPKTTLSEGVLRSAEAVLAEEEGKLTARESLSVACKVGTITALHEAVRQAELAGLSAVEYHDAMEALHKLAAEHEVLLDILRVASSEGAAESGAPRADISMLSAAKEKLQSALDAAKAKGVPQAQLAQFERQRRKIHNAIEDVKGSTRVFCRVRPLNAREKVLGDVNVVTRTDDMNVEVLGVRGRQKFQYDAVFAPGTQAETFDDCVDLVQSAVDGYNVALLAYGQTGAGKTFTMSGTREEPGLSRRTIDEVYRLASLDDTREYTIAGSMVEIYKQDLIDLLSPASAREKGLLIRQPPARLRLRQGRADGAPVVEGLTETRCATATSLLDLMERGTAARRVAATRMNAESSRSHLVFTIRITTVNRETLESLTGKILLVDLAGSERQSRSLVVAENARETIEINKSLTALADVIEALARGSRQVPYRNHPLTLLMQDALGGGAKTLLFVNCSPARSSAEESLTSLKWASRAKSIVRRPEAQSPGRSPNGPNSSARSGVGPNSSARSGVDLTARRLSV